MSITLPTQLNIKRVTLATGCHWLWCTCDMADVMPVMLWPVLHQSNICHPCAACAWITGVWSESLVTQPSVTDITSDLIIIKQEHTYVTTVVRVARGVVCIISLLQWSVITSMCLVFPLIWNVLFCSLLDTVHWCGCDHVSGMSWYGAACKECNSNYCHVPGLGVASVARLCLIIKYLWVRMACWCRKEGRAIQRRNWCWHAPVVARQCPKWPVQCSSG